MARLKLLPRQALVNHRGRVKNSAWPRGTFSMHKVPWNVAENGPGLIAMPAGPAARGEKRVRGHSRYLYDFSIDTAANAGQVMHARRINGGCEACRSFSSCGKLLLALQHRLRGREKTLPGVLKMCPSKFKRSTRSSCCPSWIRE